MGDLLGSLTTAARALDTQRFGLDVTGHNIANVNTPGYTRRVADFAAVPPDSPQGAGRGVDVAGMRAIRDRLLDARLQQSVTAERREAAVAEALAIVETGIGMPGASIDGRLSAFFDAFAALAESPTSPVARQQVLAQGDALAISFREMSFRLDGAQRDLDGQVRAAVDEVNALVSQIAAINEKIGEVTGNGVLHLQDEQAGLVRQLSALVDVSVIDRRDGGVEVSFGNGRPLVVGTVAATLAAVSTPPSGRVEVTADGAPVAQAITSGRLGGLLHVRDALLPDYQARLDAVAFAVVQQVNAIHQAGYDQSGAQNRDFFVPAGAQAGAARSIALDPALVSDAGRIAAASAPASGDNGAARAIAALRDARVLDGGTATFTESWAQLVYRVGRDARLAADERRSRQELVGQIDRLRDQVSGVSLDEEALNLLKFQRAYEANARFFSVIDRTLDILMQSLGR